MANTIRFKRGGGTLPGSYVGSGEPIWDETNKKFHVAYNGTSTTWVGAAILDEDAMSSDSAISLATQQSIKAYVDTQITAQDLDFTIDGAGSYAVDLDSQSLNVIGGTGISASASGQAITIAGSDATTSVKGIASYSADNFSATSGVITIKDGGVANAELVNSALTVTAGDGLSGGGSVSLGASTSLAVDLNEFTAAVVDVANDSVAIIDATDSGSKKEAIADIISAIAGTGITATSGVLSVDSSQAITSVSGDFTVTGNLTVSGDTVTENVATVQSEDGLMQLGYKSGGYTTDDVDIGFYGAYSDDAGTTTEYSGIFRDASNGDGVWTFFDSLVTAPGNSTNAVTVDVGVTHKFRYAALKCADITGIDDDGVGNASLSGFDIDGGTY